MRLKQNHPDRIRNIVRDNYGKIAEKFGACCDHDASRSCCSGVPNPTQQIGYSQAQTEAADPAAGMSLGCGNPQSIAALKTGETVLDLGSGAGFDAILAAKAVGQAGHVIGVDMTDNMIHKARENVQKLSLEQVEFRKGEIERLPIDDNSVDVILSNCVINLSPDKRAVFQEAHRVLKPGGRLAISDMVALRPLPNDMQSDMQLYCACISGAAVMDDLHHILATVGFKKIRITPLNQSEEIIQQCASGNNSKDYVVSAQIQAEKPA